MSVIDIQEYKKKLKQNKSTLDIKSIFINVADELIVTWEYFAKRKAINELLIDELKLDEKKDYLNDLNNIADLEKKIGIVYVCFSPRSLHKDQTGYVAGFSIDDESFAGPEMISESYARAFNILLFSYFMKVLKDIKK
jgi:hypothetical protein